MLEPTQVARMYKQKNVCFWLSGSHLHATTQHVAFQQTLIGLFRNLWYGGRQDDIQNGKNREECAACASDEMKARRRQWRFSPNWVWYWMLHISLSIHFGLIWVYIYVWCAFSDTCSFPTSSGGFSTSEVEYPRLFFRILGDIFGNMYCLRHSRKIKYLGTTKTP